MTVIQTNYDTVAGRADDGTEYVILPVYESKCIFAYKLPSGGAAKIRGVLTVPEDAELIQVFDMDDCSDAEAAYRKCERLITEL